MKLAKRERYFVIFAGCFFAVFFLFRFGITPFFEKRDRFKKGITAKMEGQAEILRLRAEYETLQRGSQNLEHFLARRDKRFTLFAFLEKAAGESGVKERIKSMKPSSSKGTGPHKESMVEMQLEGITLSQLTDYLYRIESPENIVTIRRISIKENLKEAGYLEAVLQALTYE